MNQDNILEIENSIFNNTKEERKPVKKGAGTIDWKSILLYTVLALILVVAAVTVIYTKLNKYRGSAQSLNDFSSATISPEEEQEFTQVGSNPLSPEGFAIVQQAKNTAALPQQTFQDTAINQQSQSPMVLVEQGGDKFYLPQNSAISVSSAPANQDQKVNDSNEISDRVNIIETKLESVPTKEELANLLTEINSVKIMIANLKTQSEVSKSTKPTVHRSVSNSKPAGASVPRVNNSAPVKRQTVPTNITSQPALKLRAVVQDQAWLENASGETISVSISNPYIAGYGKVVRFDGESFKICFDSGRCISQ